MKKKIFYAPYTISLFLIPFLSQAQPTQPFPDHPVTHGPLGANNPPIANNDAVSICQEGDITINVQANDSDPDGDVMVTSIVSGPSNGIAMVTGTSIYYAPDFGFYGVDSINYVICDNGIPSMCDTATVIITVTQAPVADAGPDQTICFGDVTTIGTPSIAGNTYLWSPSAGLSSTTVAQPFCSPTVTSTTYTLSVHSTLTGCDNSDLVTITVNPIPIADAGPDHTICEQDSVQLGTPGTPGNTYYWTPIAPLNNNSIPQPTASPDSTTTFLLVVTTTATGCYNTDSTVVNIIPGPPTDAGPNKTICPGQSVVIGTPAVPGNTYSWSPAIGLSSTSIAQPTANPAVTTTYVLTVTNTATGCTDSNSVTVIVNPPPLAVTGLDQTICSGDSIMIGGPSIPGNTYSWTPTTGLSNPNISNPWASPTVTTTYTLTETAGVGCSATNSVTITVIPGAIANAGADISICTGASTVIGSPGVSGSTYVWTPALGLSSTIIAQPTATPSSTSTYVLIVTNIASGCIATDSVTITVLSPPNADAGPDQTICNGDSVLIGSAPVAGETYSWSPSAGLSSSTVAQPNASPSSTTTYTLTVSNAGCSDSDNVMVSVNPLPTANAGANASICPGQSITIGSAAVAGNTYSWSPADGLNDSTLAQPTASPMVTTTYILTVSNGSTTCTNSDSVTITVSPVASIDAGADVTICEGDSTLIGSPAVSGLTYSWSPATGLSAANWGMPTAFPSVTTTYVLTVTDTTGGCSGTDTVTVTVNPTPTADAGADVTICEGDSVLIGSPAVSGFTYSWSPTTGLSASTWGMPTAFPSVTTTYIVTVTNDSTGCSDTDTVTVTVNPTATADAGADATICVGDSTVIGGPGVIGSTYSWSPSTGLSSTTAAQPTATPSVTTTYVLTINNSSGCSDTDSVTITVISGPTADAGPDTSMCAGDSVAIGVSPVTGYTYSWSPSSGLSNDTIANPMASPADNATYVLTVSVGSGCVSSDTVNIIVNDPPVADSGPDTTICAGASIVIGGPGVIGNTYNWSPSTGLSSTTAAQPNANPSVTTTYILTVNNGTTGCSDTDSVTITVNPVPTADAGADQTICGGDSVAIGVSPVTGYTYSWSPSSGLSTDTISNPMASPSDSTTYIVTVSNGSSCVSTDSVTILVIDPPVADAGPDQNTCVSGPVIIGTPAATGTSYSWSPSAGLSSSTAAQPTANPSVTTTYVLTITNTSTGCTDSDTVEVAVGPLTGVDAGADMTVCAGDSVTIGGTPHAGSTYSWSPSTGLSSTTAANPSAAPTSTTTYIMTETNSTGCSGTDTVVVTVNDTLTADAGADQTICEGSSVTIGTTPVSSYTYSWSPATGLSSSTVAQPDANPTITTTYILTVGQTGSSCSASDTVTITVIAAPVADAGTDQAMCSQDTVALGAGPVTGYTYSWSPTTGLSSSTVANPGASPEENTTYVLTVSDGTCSSTDTVVVNINSFPLRMAGEDQLLCGGGSIVLGTQANADYTYEWSPGTNLSSTTVAQPVCTATENTMYTLSVTDGITGCTTRDSVFVTVQGTGIYTGISPNGDGINDTWTIPMLDCYTANTVTILNRWGAEVWKASDYNNNDVKWNGKNLDGDDLPDGTYYYVIAYNDTEKRGWVFIKR